MHIQLMGNLILTREQINQYNASRGLSERKHLCNAPFTSLYFNHKGDVSVCCWNHAYPIGRYGSAPLKEIWFGHTAKFIRRKIDCGDLSYGCAKCYDKISSGDYYGVMSKTYDNYHVDDKLPMPKVVTFEISNTCNLECEMCWGYYSSKIRAKVDRLPKVNNPYDESIINELEFFLPQLEEIRFLGGEPLLIPIYLDIIEKIKKSYPTIRVSITSNGTIWSEELAKTLSCESVHLNISIDSFVPEVYESIRKGSSFSIVEKNLAELEKLNQLGTINLGISFCPMRSNWKEIPSIISNLDKKNIGLYLNSTFYPTSVSLRSLHPNYLDEILSFYKKAITESELEAADKEQLHGLTQQLTSWRSLNRKLFSYTQQQIERKSALLCVRKSDKVVCIVNILNRIHWKTIQNECNTDGFKNDSVMLKNILRNASENVIPEFLEAIQLLPAIYESTPVKLESAVNRFINFLKSKKNSYRVLISFIAKNDIIYLLQTLDSELISNMKTFADYEKM